MPGLNPKRRPKLTLEDPKPGQGKRGSKRSSSERRLTPNERMRQLEGRVGELEATLRALLVSTGMNPNRAQRYAPIHIQGDPLSSTILRDRGAN
ncbi:MAG: hypothetical protein ACLGXA_02185 [Acidobacteriota bacterium]